MTGTLTPPRQVTPAAPTSLGNGLVTRRDRCDGHSLFITDTNFSLVRGYGQSTMLNSTPVAARFRGA